MLCPRCVKTPPPLLGVCSLGLKQRPAPGVWEYYRAQAGIPPGGGGVDLLGFVRCVHDIAVLKIVVNRGVLKGQDFFFVKDRPSGPPQGTINRQPPTATNRHQPPTTSGNQTPTANHCQPPSTTNPQPPTAANHHQPPPTATNCQSPTANRQHMVCPRVFSGKVCNGTLFPPLLRTALVVKQKREHIAKCDEKGPLKDVKPAERPVRPVPPQPAPTHAAKPAAGRAVPKFAARSAAQSSAQLR